MPDYEWPKLADDSLRASLSLAAECCRLHEQRSAFLFVNVYLSGISGAWNTKWQCIAPFYVRIWHSHFNEFIDLLKQVCNIRLNPDTWQSNQVWAFVFLKVKNSSTLDWLHTSWSSQLSREPGIQATSNSTDSFISPVWLLTYLSLGQHSYGCGQEDGSRVYTSGKCNSSGFTRLGRRKGFLSTAILESQSLMHWRSPLFLLML